MSFIQIFKASPRPRLQALLLPIVGNFHQVPACKVSTKPEIENVENDRSESMELILSVLRSNATKRDAKAYISRYQSDVAGPEVRKRREAFADKVLHSVRELSSGFDSCGSTPIEIKEFIRVAVIKIRAPEKLSTNTIRGIGLTLARLKKLGLYPLIVLDPSIETQQKDTSITGSERPEIVFKRVNRLADKVATALEVPPSSTTSLAIDETDDHSPSLRSGLVTRIMPTLFVQDSSSSTLSFLSTRVLVMALTAGVVPIITPLVYNEETCRTTLVQADDIVYEIVRQIGETGAEDVMELDKIIYIDPLGGIPSLERNSGAHVLVNLEQEYDDIIEELCASNMLDEQGENAIGIHIRNLIAFERVLEIASTSVSGLITTPEVAASKSTRNPLIYNLLTDRPIISSSLPVESRPETVQMTTLLRKGLPVMTLYSQEGMWVPHPGREPNGKEVAIDIRKLVALIEDSFGWKLDVDHYLDRVNGKIAGLVIVGDYEGAAIITWESFSGDSSKRVAYLDKLAVLKRSQGAAGVADIVFKAMVMQLFPEELIWRSRTANPVNKWYFDRSHGCIRLLPERKWTLFWTGRNTRELDHLQDYMDICRRIEPSFR
ncbi:hypothetical protein V1511DRAFT_494053 [Dipodascopsis uninucleata]